VHREVQSILEMELASSPRPETGPFVNLVSSTTMVSASLKLNATHQSTLNTCTQISNQTAFANVDLYIQRIKVTMVSLA
jgi:hypothetical protein